jgi:hypothetical protein
MHMTANRSNHALELERIRFLNGTAFLRHFASRNATWELLWIILELEANGDYGISDYIDRLKTLRTTRLTIQNFIKDRLQEGSLIVTESNKKSRKTLALSEALKIELKDYFSWLSEKDLLPDAIDTYQPVKNGKAHTAANTQ